MTETLTLNDGTELYGYAEEKQGELVVFVHGKTMAEMFALLTDPEKTSRFVSARNGGTKTYTGFTHLQNIYEIDTQFISAAMVPET